MDDPWNKEGAPDGEDGGDDPIQTKFIRGCLSNDISLISSMLSEPTTVSRIALDRPDESGSPGLLIASCFGYSEIVELLLNAGANVNAHDSRGWSALMWSTNNHHTSIAKILIDNGADREAVTKNGRNASNFCTDEELKSSLSREGSQFETTENGDDVASVGKIALSGGDWYGAASGLDFEESLREQEQAKRMALEAGMNLEVDLGALSLDPADNVEDDTASQQEDEQAFVWDHCLPSQMFVFSEGQIPEIVKLVVSDYPPQRNPSQKPVPANLLFLSSRFAHYYSTPKMLSELLENSLTAIEIAVNKKHDDMTILSFWISNCLLLQYYLRKDLGLEAATSETQLRLSELINEIYVLLVSDAQRRIEKILVESILDYSAIEGLADLEMSDEWRLFRRKQQSSSVDRELSPRRRRGASPRNITSLLSSTMYVLEAYALHPIIIIQALAQIVFWFSAELFNRILRNKKYLSRGKAMDLRMNISQVEEWLRNNNRTWQERPDLSSRCKAGLKRVVGLLQLLQCLSSLKEDEVKSVVDSIEGISARQALYVAENYRSERTEAKIPRSTKASLAALEREQSATLAAEGEGIFVDASSQLPFSLPTSTDLILTYGAGIGGTQRENEKMFTPTLPTEILEKLDTGSLSSADRAKGYVQGVGGDAIRGTTNKDFDTLQREAEEERIASLVGVNSGVW